MQIHVALMDGEDTNLVQFTLALRIRLGAIECHPF